MLLSKLNYLFHQEEPLDEFIKEIESEISGYKKSLAKRGSSSPVFLKEDIFKIIVNERNVSFLCDSFLQGKIDKWELNYIAEALLLSEKAYFSSSKVRDALLSLTDAEYYSIVNEEFIREIMKEINSTQASDN